MSSHIGQPVSLIWSAVVRALRPDPRKGSPEWPSQQKALSRTSGCFMSGLPVSPTALPPVV